MKMDNCDRYAERRKNRGFLGYDSSALSAQDLQDRTQLRSEIDLNSWNLRIWMVAASGFLTDSYNLFSTNVILASVAFVYWPNDRWPALIVNGLTLFGSVVGQLLFGFLADYFGRTRLYGIELVLVIVSTIGVATSSYGYNDLSFLALFTFWRFVMGIGIGAEYPLSAVITSEWSSTRSRATMIASVFLMQPVGQALAQVIGLLVLLGRNREYDLKGLQCGISTTHEEECKKIVDGIWRIVIGIGAVPALLAIVFRFFLYDCGLYSLEVKNKPGTALGNTRRIYGPVPHPNELAASNENVNGAAFQASNGFGEGRPISPQPMPIQFSLVDLYNYFIRDGNWYYLLGTAATWFVLDVGFYGFSLDNRGTLANMWATKGKVHLDSSLDCWDLSEKGGNSTLPTWAAQLGGRLPAWHTDNTEPCSTLFDILLGQGKQYLLTVSLGSILGSCCFIAVVDRIQRRRFLTTSFIVLSVLFMITGGVYYGVNQRVGAPATVALVAICHFMFNFGANTLTFIIPAEIFPTTYRCTCHGISAAAGKAGSIVALLLVYAINTAYAADNRQGLVFLLFGFVLAFGAIFSWAYLPDIQRRVWYVDPRTGRQRTRLETKNLEDLGEGRAKALREEGEVLTVREKLAEMKRRRRVRRQELE